MRCRESWTGSGESNGETVSPFHLADAISLFGYDEGMANKCQRCPKPVAYHVTDIRDDGTPEDYQFCVDCAKAFLVSTPVVPAAKEKGTDDDSGAREATSIGERQCPDCGMKFVEFRNGGRLGCPHDYDVFREDLLPLMEGVHSGTKHVGKTPRQKAASRARAGHQELTTLRKKLQKAIDAEKYEEAASLRDQIRTLESA